MKTKSTLLAGVLIFAVATQTKADTAEKCMAVGKSINTASEKALGLKQFKGKAEDTSQETFKLCGTYLELNCGYGKWIDQQQSIRSYCQKAVLTNQRRMDEADARRKNPDLGGGDAEEARNGIR